MPPFRLSELLLTALTPLTSACSSVTGPHALRVEQHQGISVFRVEGYGVNLFRQGDSSAIHVGHYRRTIAVERDFSEETFPTIRAFSLLSRLPDRPALHFSSVNSGLTLALEPTFCGVSLGCQFRQVSRLPLDRDLIFETVLRNNRPSKFSLRHLP